MQIFALLTFFVFIVSLLFYQNIIINVTGSILFTALAFLFVNLTDQYGKKIHSNIFNRLVFVNLVLKGFKKEVIGNYKGLYKCTNGYSIRLYYDWNKIAESKLSFGDIAINIYYKPLSIDESITDLERIEQLNNLHKKQFSSKKLPQFFQIDRLVIRLNYFPWTKSTKIEEAISNSIEKLVSNSLAPMDINNLNDEHLKRFKSEGRFLPFMQHIWEDHEKKAGNKIYK